MPMYFDLRQTKRPQTLTGPHVELVTSFFETGIRHNDYFDRAKRDLEGLVGMRTAAARGKFDPKEVFGE